MSAAARQAAPAGFPRPVVFAIVGVVVLALAAAGFFRLGGHAPDASAVPLSDARSVLFRDAPDGSVVVLDAASGELVRRYAAGSGGFTRGMMRGLSRQRSARGISLSLPFVIGWRGDRRLILRDPSTSTDIVLDAFGRSNRSVFEALIEKSQGPLQLAGDSRS
jgi:putative photosynthetic complex assembly protein